MITIDGATGEVMAGEVATIEPEMAGDFGTLMEWADRHRRMKVRANAETEADCQAARRFGAEGMWGLTRVAPEPLEFVLDSPDLGVLSRTDASRSRLSSTLSSAIGGRQTAPAVTRMISEWGNVGLLCSDGLTRHVSDARIRDVLRSMTSAKQVCEDLLEEALEGGGTDNITVVLIRALAS